MALILFILFIPLYILISLLIKLDSKGPVIFKQKRVGYMGRYFYIYKFRSMKVDTPNLATDKLENPELYITKLGKLLRKSSLDELPQLINIIKGEMSFVGPRPALYNQEKLIMSREEKGINNILPGLTGYAQVMGRDLISDDQKIEYDYIYLKNMSIGFDFKILVMTFYSVIKAKGVSN